MTALLRGARRTVDWLETRRIPVFFALATLLPIAALCWLSVRTLAQDRELERQRRAERLRVAADRVALDMERDLQEIEARLGQGRGIRFHAGGMSATDGEPILFQPDVSIELGSLTPELTAAAQLEYQNPAAAIDAYRRIARTSSGKSKGEALVALGGLLRRQQHIAAALLAYDELAILGAERVAGGQPAGLVALQGRGKTLEEADDRERLRETAAALSRTLGAGGWPIDRTTFEIYRELAERWGGARVDDGAVQRAERAAELWRVWRRGELPPRDRRFVGSTDSPVLAVWVASADGPVVAMMSALQLEARWRSLWEALGLSAAIWHPDGRPVFGTAGVNPVNLSPAETRLPFGMTVAATTSFSPAGGTLRRNAVIAGVIFAAFLMVAGSYGLYRVTTRELQLARQQSDFVAAVSHEFRTPLTSMRHLIDLLATRAIASEERKAHYYELLGGETERLQRMVETLLSFGRLDAGAHVWRREPVAVAELIDDALQEFDREAGDRQVLVEIDPELPDIRGDREALGRALWNLLENAAKYSPPGSPIRVFATTRPDVVSGFSRTTDTALFIGVQDHGIGIPVAEQQRVFQKFVRGDEARRAGIRGVGIGLALVKRIVDAHGGSVRLESQINAGSTFTLELPVIHSQLPTPDRRHQDSPTVVTG